MKISWIILTWNSENVIEKCIKSILGLNEFKNQIIIIDNGSSDKTLTILKKYSDNNECVQLILLDRNYGTTIPRNKGLQNIARDTNYICILDSDTIVNNAAISTMIAYLENDEHCGIVGPKLCTSDGVVQMSGRSLPTVTIKFLKAIPIKRINSLAEKSEMPRQYNETRPYIVDYLMSACWFIRPDIIKQVGYLDEKIFYAPEDVEYCIRIWQSGYRIVLCPNAEIIHEWQRISKKKFISRMNWEHIKGLAYMFKKHRYLFSSKKIKRQWRYLDENLFY